MLPLEEETRLSLFPSRHSRQQHAGRYGPFDTIFESRTQLVVLLMGSNYTATQRWRLKVKQWLIRYGGGQCQVCGYNRYYGNLTFHHVGKKRDSLSRMVAATVAWRLILQEAGKCVLLCCICHGEIHAGLIPCPEIDREERAIILSQIEAEKPVVKRRVKRPCAKCGKPARRKYCSLRCHGLDHAVEKAIWPSDEVLARMVWEQPVTLIAISFGVSDVAVKKRCRTRGISTPGVGYWSKHRASLALGNASAS